MTSSSSASRSSSTECDSQTTFSRSSTVPQLLKSQPRRAVNQPPYRLVFESVTTIPVAKKDHKNEVATLHQQLPSPNDGSQESTSVPLRQVASTTLKQEPESLYGKAPSRETSIPLGVVYMLHGWAQNVHVFSNRARKLTKRLNKAGYKVIFLQGPHRLPPIATNSTSSTTATVTEEKDPQHSIDGHVEKTSSFSRKYAYSWFLYENPCNDGKDEKESATSSDQTPVLKPSPTGDFRGMDASLAFLRNELQADRNEFRGTRMNRQDSTPSTVPPFFLLGFSQGAVLVHKVATLACGSDSTDASQWSDIEKCILVSGFSFTTSIRADKGSDIHNTKIGNDQRIEGRPHPRTTARRRTMPSFHVVGRKDSRVSPRLTLELHSMEPCFGRRESHQNILWEHDRGHVLPQDQEFCDQLLKFLALSPIAPDD